MTLRMCVLLWARDDREDELHLYEDRVLALLDDHDGRLVTRDRVQRQNDDDPTEVQIVEFASRTAMDDYLGDPRRTALHDERDAAIADTKILSLAG